MSENDAWARYARWHDDWISGPIQVTGSDMEARIQLDKCLDEYAAIKRELFLDGFCDFVIKQGFGAATPNKRDNKPESWQQCGRRLWGREHFDTAMIKAIARSRAAKTSSRTSPESSSY